MDAEDSYLDEVYERFNQAVMNAIVHSEEVRGILKEIGHQGYINESSVFNLFLSLEELDRYIHSKSSGSTSSLFPGNLQGLRGNAETPSPEAGTPPPENETEAPAPPAPPQIDGRKLTETEFRYLEYCMRHFNEEDWLKKARLKF